MNHIKNNKEDILVDMIMNYLTTGVIEVFRFNDTQTNLFHLLRTLEGHVTAYPEDQKRSFFREYYNLIKDFNNKGFYFDKHKKYAWEMAR